MTSKDYYEALADSYLHTIFRSGLLLDEDLQILMNYYRHEELSSEFPQYRPSLALKLSVWAALGSLMLMRRLSYWIIVPPLAITTVAAVLEIRNNNKMKKEKKLAADIIYVSKRIHSLNSSIKKYIKTRAEIENKSQNEFFVSYTTKIENFFKSVLLIEIDFFETFMENIKLIVSFSNELKDDFESFSTFQPLKIEETQCDKVEDVLTFISQIQDLHIWMTSKLLSYIGILFLSPNAKLNNKEIEKLLNLIIPAFLNFMFQHFDAISKLFFTLRNSESKLTELRQQARKPNLPNKFSNTLITAIDNISIISEKSQSILTELEGIDDLSSRTIEASLADLRNHTYATYESLDLLCRLYGILSSKKLPPDESIVSFKTTQSKETTNLANIHHDDNVAPIEENYELYLEKDYEVPVEDAKIYKEDNSGIYLGLMLQELRQSLKKHERFVEAKRRRGSVDEDEIVSRERETLPRFNVDVLKDNLSTNNKSVDSENIHEDLSFGVSTSLPATPAPPPLPNFELGQFTDLKSKSMFEGIRTLSSQLNMQEEVFGESDEEDDE